MSGPGSKKPDPSVEVPVTVTFTEGLDPTAEGVADDGVAGPRARTSITRTPQESVPFAYSWKAQNVWLSVGSIDTCE